jgi:hypothetical protein
MEITADAVDIAAMENRLESSLPDIETPRPVAVPTELTCSKYSRTISKNYLKWLERKLVRNQFSGFPFAL